MKDEWYEQIKPLAKTVQSRLAEAQKANDEAEVTIERINALRGEMAAELAETQFKITPGTYIQDVDGALHRVESLSADRLNKYQFDRDTSSASIVETLETSKLFAECVRINRGTGKPQTRKS